MCGSSTKVSQVDDIDKPIRDLKADDLLQIFLVGLALLHIKVVFL